MRVAGERAVLVTQSVTKQRAAVVCRARNDHLCKGVERKIGCEPRAGSQLAVVLLPLHGVWVCMSVGWGPRVPLNSNNHLARRVTRSIAGVTVMSPAHFAVTCVMALPPRPHLLRTSARCLVKHTRAAYAFVFLTMSPRMHASKRRALMGSIQGTQAAVTTARGNTVPHRRTPRTLASSGRTFPTMLPSCEAPPLSPQRLAPPLARFRSFLRRCGAHRPNPRQHIKPPYEPALAPARVTSPAPAAQSGALPAQLLPSRRRRVRGRTGSAAPAASLTTCE